MIKRIFAGLTALVAAAAATPGTNGAELPAATKKALADLRLDASILAGLDAELAVPGSWIEAAAKEKPVIVLGTWREQEFRDLARAFSERYPGVKLAYDRASTSGRGIKVVVALREGRVLADVITSVADSYTEFKKVKALADLRELPGFRNLPTNYVADDGTWAAYKVAFRCIGYNTKLVSKADLPKTWDDLVRSPRWRGDKLALSNHPNSWLLALWAAKGETWGRDFTRRLFVDLGPQQRKEGMMSTTALAVAGEFHANLPAPERRTETYAEKGAPIGYHCPEPVPITLSQIVMLDKAPNRNGARIFVNWLLSAEGQLLQFATSSSVPSHKSLQQRRFVPFADTIVGKPAIVRDEELLGGPLHKAMMETWNSYWTKSAEDARKGKKGRQKQNTSEEE